MAKEKRDEQGALFQASEIPLVEQSSQISSTVPVISASALPEPPGQSLRLRLRRHEGPFERVAYAVREGIERLMRRPDC